MSERSVAGPRHRVAQAPPGFLHNARWGLLAGSMLLAGVTWRLAGGGVYSWQLVCAWLSSVVVWLLAWWPALTPWPPLPSQATGEGEDRFPLARASARARGLAGEGLTVLLLSLILVVAAFFRFYNLAEVPREPTSDHAEKLLDVLDVLQGRRPIFFPRNTGREPAQFYWSALLIGGFGFPFSWDTLKWGTALIGLAAVPAVFLVGRELRGNTAGLIAALLFAIGKWPTSLSRAGLRYPLALLPAALVVWSLLRYLRRPDRRVALLCGLVIGAGLHGYISFRIVPLLVPLFLGVGLIMSRRLRAVWRAVLADGALIAATALLVCLPLARYSVLHPDEVWYRVATRAADTERSLGDAGEQLKIFAANNLRALGAFNLRGDGTKVIAVSYDPLLDPLTGAAFAGGVVLTAYTAVRRRDPRYAALLLAVPVLLLPSTLSIAFPHENPSANRLGVAGVVVFPLAGLPIALLLGLARRQRVLRLASAAALAVLLLLAARHNYLRYFRDYDAQYRAFVPNTSHVAAAISARLELGIALDDVYLLAFPHWLDGRNIAFALGDIGWKKQHDLASDAPLPEPKPGVAMLYVLNAADTTRLAQLRLAYPRGYEELVTPPVGDVFVLYTVPPAVAGSRERW